MNYKVDEKLFELQMACKRYSVTDPLADWVLFAISRYIDTGRATTAFLKAFLRFPNDRLQELIRKSLNGDRSDDGIMKTVKRVIREDQE